MARALSVLIFILSALAARADLQPGQPAFLTTEEGEYVSVYKEPGLNWKSCQMPCKAVAWPERNATEQLITVTGPKIKKETIDPYTGKKVMEEYYPVEVSYIRQGDNPERTGGIELVIHEKTPGYMPASTLSDKPVSTFYGPVSSTSVTQPAPKEKCPPAIKNKNAEIPTTAPKESHDISETASRETVSSAAGAMSRIVGKCEFKEDSSLAELKGIPPRNAFDILVLPEIMESPAPGGYLDEDEKPMTNRQMLAISALARTLYGEAASCFKHGLQYPMAIAKVMMNRSKSQKRASEFIRGQHDGAKGPLSKVATSASQFHVWKPYDIVDDKQPAAGDNIRMNGAFNLATCPPADPDQNFWAGIKPPKAEQKLWENTMKIATEAVLYPARFSERTKNVTQVFYTSYFESAPKFARARAMPEIEGRKVEDDCVQLWDE